MASAIEAVSLQNACLTYRRGKNAIMVLDHLNMSVPKGSIYGLLGASGCGKTTLLGCIAGRLRLNSGDLQVLGGVPGTKGSGVPGPSVGYMPQEVALVNEMNVKNVIYYFGWLFGMSSPQIAERYEFLSKLLELPDDDKLVKHLSGGQQRRVSFAAALVQTPELLILDEPTVGLDPVLRQNIWDYLVQLSRDMNMTVIITTHYIEEATQAHKIGLMREGTLLADMAPNELIVQQNCSTLEEVFLKLSRIQGVEEQASSSRLPIIENQDGEEDGGARINDRNQENRMETVSLKTNSRPRLKNNSSPSFRSKLKALMYKDCIAILRNPAGLLFMFFLPVIQMTLFFPTVGIDPQGLAIGIVNDESTNCDELIGDLRKHSGVTVEQDMYQTCHFGGLSCLFIDKMNEDETTKKIFYVDQTAALAATKKLITSATIHIPSNFSQMLELRLDDLFEASNETVEMSQIKVWLDMSSYLIGYKLQRQIYAAYKSLSEDIAVGCNQSIKTHELPIQFQDPIYGDDSTNMREFMAPGYIIAMVFFLAAMETATVLTSELSNGVWIRNLVAGVSPSESILSHILCQITGMIIQMSEILLITFYVFDMQCKGNISSVLVIVFLQCVAGSAFGLLIGSFSKDTTAAMYITVGSFLPYFLIMGTIWPLEGSPTALQFISKWSPGTLAGGALRNIMSRGWGVIHPQVYPGYLMSVAWIVGQFAISIWVLKKK